MLSIPRSRVNAIPEVQGIHRSYYNGSPSGYNIASITKQSSSSMDDYVTPGFRKLIDRGEIVNNPCSMVVNQRNVLGSGYYKGIRNGSRTYEVYGDGSLTDWILAYSDYVPPSELEYDEDKLEQEARLAALSYVDSSPYEFLEDVGEIRETLAFLRRPMSSVLKLAKQFRKKAFLAQKRRGRIVRTYAEASASVWLEYRFAVMPLVRSIQGISESLGDTVHRPKRRTARGFSDFNPGNVGASSCTWSGVNVNLNDQRELTSDVRAGILYSVSNPKEDFFYKYGLRLSDIPETAWNLLPLSFMVDRLVDISSSIRSITNLGNPSVSNLAGWVTVKTNSERTTTVTSLGTLPGWVFTLTPDTVYEKNFLYKRSVWVPSLVDAVPTINIDNVYNSATKSADLLALAASFAANKIGR